MGLGKKDLDFIKLTSLPSRLEANKAYLIKTGDSSFTIYLTDSKCNALVLDSASYELFFNSIDNSLSLIISSTGQVISKVFLTDLLDSSIASVNINPLDDTIIEFKNSDGVILSSLTLTIDNIQSLQSELDNKVSYLSQTKTEPEKQQARDNIDVYSDSEIDNFFSGGTPITGYNKVNWDTAFGWGDHSGLYEPLFSKGDLVQGTGLTLSGTLTNRLVGAGNITVAHASHTGDVTGSSSLTIANDVVSNLKLSNVAQNTIKGRISTGTGDPEDLNPTQVRAILNIEDGANNYVHPAYSTFSLDTSGAQVIDLLSTDAIGSVTNITTRNLTPSDIGAADSIHTHTVSDITDFPSLVTELSDLSDVNTSTPTNRNVLVADGVDFESRALETDDIQSGTFTDARISQSSIVQHEAALTITESQISDLQNYSLVGHTHTTTDITDLSSYTGFDSRYYTESEVNALLHDPVTVTDSSEIDFTLTGQDITASIIAGSIGETKLDVSVNTTLNEVVPQADLIIKSPESIGTLNNYWVGTESEMEDILLIDPTALDDIFIVCTDCPQETYLTPTGNGSGLTGLTTSQITNLSSYIGLDGRYYTETETDNILEDFVKIADNIANEGYVLINRSSSTNPPLFVNQTGTGAIARFYKGASSGDFTGTGVFEIENNGNVSVSGQITATRLNLTSLPTSAAGLSTGDVWNDSGTLKIV